MIRRSTNLNSIFKIRTMELFRISALNSKFRYWNLLIRFSKLTYLFMCFEIVKKLSVSNSISWINDIEIGYHKLSFLYLPKYFELIVDNIPDISLRYRRCVLISIENFYLEEIQKLKFLTIFRYRNNF